MTEVARSMVVVVAAALLMQTFGQLRRIEPGFRSEDVLTVSVRLPQAVQTNIHRRSAFDAQVLERLDEMPGVAGAAVTTAAPLVWKGGSNGLSVDGRPRSLDRAPCTVSGTISCYTLNPRPPPRI